MHLSASFREEKKRKESAINEFGFCVDVSQRSTAQQCHIDTPFLYNTQKSRYLKFRRASAPYWP